MKYYYQNTRPEMVQFLPPRYLKVLEIGCGTGAFRRNLKNQNEYWGVEVDISAAELAKSKLDKVLNGYFLEKSLDIPNNYFDLVICNDVIEHIDDYESFIMDIKNKMTHDACLVLSVPNIRHMQCLYHLMVKKDWQYQDHGVLDRTHLRFFTYKSLVRLIEKNDFEILKIQGINSVYERVSLIRKIFLYIAAAVLGQDTLYLQFGLSAKIRQHHPSIH